MTTIGLDDLGTSTTLESNKSHARCLVELSRTMEAAIGFQSQPDLWQI